MYKCCARIVSDDRCMFCTYIVHLFPRCCCKNWRWIHETAYWSLIDQICTFLLKKYSHRKIFSKILNIDIGIISCSFFFEVLFLLTNLEKNICRNFICANLHQYWIQKSIEREFFIPLSIFSFLYTQKHISNSNLVSSHFFATSDAEIDFFYFSNIERFCFTCCKL